MNRSEPTPEPGADGAACARDVLAGGVNPGESAPAAAPVHAVHTPEQALRAARGELELSDSEELSASIGGEISPQQSSARPEREKPAGKSGPRGRGGKGGGKKPAGKRKKSRVILTVLLIVIGVVALVLAGVRLITGSSLFELISAAFNDDYRPSAVGDGGDFAPLVGSGSNASLPGGLSAGEGEGEDGPVTPPEGYDITRKEGCYNFLVCGVNNLNGTNNSDTMFLLHFDVNEGKVNIVQIPRDAYFSYYKEKHNFHKINSYYTAYYNKARSAGKKEEEAVRAGMSELRAFIEDVYCVKLDYYVYLDLEAFVEVVDAVGGVTVNVPQKMDYDDPEGDLDVHLKPGVQHMDGKTALGFVRFRKGYSNSDYARMDAQKIFMSAFMQQIKDNFSVSTAAKLATTVFDSLVCDIPSDDFVYFAKKAITCDLSNITMQTLPSGGGMADDGLWYDVICREGTVETINRALNVYKALPVTLDGASGSVQFDRDAILYDHESSAQEKIYFGSPADGLTDVYTADEAPDKVKVK